MRGAKSFTFLATFVLGIFLIIEMILFVQVAVVLAAVVVEEDSINSSRMNHLNRLLFNIMTSDCLHLIVLIIIEMCDVESEVRIIN